MSTKADALIQKADRGDRVRQVRVALKKSGDEFAEILMSSLAAFGVRARYDKGKVSKMEGGGRKITVEELAIISMIDPKERGAGWLVFGPAAAASRRELYQKVSGGKAAR